MKIRKYFRRELPMTRPSGTPAMRAGAKMTRTRQGLTPVAQTLIFDKPLAMCRWPS
jgi:hypothetical protein